MTVNKARKVVRYRGSTKHGWGRKSKHRGAGNRGGRGVSNRGKRGQSRKPSHRLERQGKSRTGFTSHVPRAPAVAITLHVLQQKAELYVAKGIAKKDKDVYVIELSKLGYDKVLATGKLTKKLKISAESFTPRAMEKLKAAGGEAIMSQKQKSSPAAPAPETA